MGQACVLMANPEGIKSPFFSSVPEDVKPAVLVIATLAVICASQAMISGVFSLFAQGHALEFLPRIMVHRTNPSQPGQLYIPEVNWILCVLCLILVATFRTSGNLAAAYGLAITADACITSILLVAVMALVWKLHLALVALIAVPLLTFDLLFFTANLSKFVEGGWWAVLVSACVLGVMNTYHWGRKMENKALGNRASPVRIEVGVSPPHAEQLLSGELDVATLAVLLRQRQPSILRTPTVCVYLSARDGCVPQSLGSLKHALGCLPATIILLTVHFESVLPFVSEEDRYSLDARHGGCGVHQIACHVGYAEVCAAASIIQGILMKAAHDHSISFPALKPMLSLATSVVNAQTAQAGIRPSAHAKILEAGLRKQAADMLELEAATGASEASEVAVTFVLNRLTYLPHENASPTFRLRLRFYSLMLSNARSARSILGLPATETLEVASVRLL